MIRPAREADLPAILDLTAAKRLQYAEYQPEFHRPALGARAAQEPFFRDNLLEGKDLMLVEEAAGVVRGFIWGKMVPPPPVYDPGGPVCMVDDFVVREPEQWATTGRALLDEVRRLARERDAVLVIVVCGPRDEPKRALLAADAFTVATEWHVHSC